MKPAPFRLERPRTLEAALGLLATEPDARPLAGGQSLVPMMNLRVVRPAVLVDLNCVAGLADVLLEGDCLRIGAMARQQHLLEHPRVHTGAPLLARALAHVGHLQTRSRGTLGGSLAHADPAAELPTVLVALDAVLVLQCASGRRLVRAREFFLDAMTTALAEGELIVEVRCPAAVRGARTGFYEFAARHGDFAIASAAAHGEPRGDGGLAITAALGGVQAVPHFCSLIAARTWPRGTMPADLHDAIDAETADLDPLSDLQCDGGHRLELAREALRRCLDEVLA